MYSNKSGRANYDVYDDFKLVYIKLFQRCKGLGIQYFHSRFLLDRKPQPEKIFALQLG